MDRGIIAKIKGFVRRRYCKWACDLTVAQLGADDDVSKVKIPSDERTCKKNLFEWLSQSVDHLNTNDKESGILHCWEATKLLRAWESKVQVEAIAKLSELFPNMQPANVSTTQQVAAILEGIQEEAPGAEDPGCR